MYTQLGYKYVQETQSERDRADNNEKIVRDLKFVVYNVSFGQDKHNFHR